MTDFVEVDCTIAEFEAILQKSVLTHEDLQKFASYCGNDDVSFETSTTITKRVIQNNDIAGWEILSDAEYYYGFQPAFDACLEYAIEYANYSTFCHIMNAYTNYSKLEYGDPISVDRLRELANKNPNADIKYVVENIISILPKNKITESMAEKRASEIARALELPHAVKRVF